MTGRSQLMVHRSALNTLAQAPFRFRRCTLQKGAKRQVWLIPRGLLVGSSWLRCQVNLIHLHHTWEEWWRVQEVATSIKKHMNKMQHFQEGISEQATLESPLSLLENNMLPTTKAMIDIQMIWRARSIRASAERIVVAHMIWLTRLEHLDKRITIHLT